MPVKPWLTGGTSLTGTVQFDSGRPPAPDGAIWESDNEGNFDMCNAQLLTTEPYCSALSALGQLAPADRDHVAERLQQLAIAPRGELYDPAFGDSELTWVDPAKPTRMLAEGVSSSGHEHLLLLDTDGSPIAVWHEQHAEPLLGLGILAERETNTEIPRVTRGPAAASWPEEIEEAPGAGGQPRWESPRRPKYAPVGAVVQSGYWGERYTVLSHNEDGSVTVYWHNKPGTGKPGCTTHRTPLGAGDKVLSCPEAGPALDAELAELRAAVS